MLAVVLLSDFVIVVAAVTDGFDRIKWTLGQENIIKQKSEGEVFILICSAIVLPWGDRVRLTGR